MTDDQRNAYRRRRDELLAAAIRALTDAARLTYQPLVQNQAGEWVSSSTGELQQADWAEFVTQALAGAAANYGGIEAILGGRSGSWEAEGVRQLLISTVGSDERHLWEHRTEPLAITLYVEEILTDVAPAYWKQYDDARTELDERYGSTIDYSRYAWEYDPTDEGEMVAREEGAPAWSWETWRHQASGDDRVSPETIEQLEQELRSGSPFGRSAYIAKSPEAAAELRRLEDEQDRSSDRFDDLDERLEEQRIAELRAYGEDLKAKVIAAAAQLEGLTVPVEVTIDVDTFRPATSSWGNYDTVEGRLVTNAVNDTPTPDDLPGTVLQRLEGGHGDTSAPH